MSKSPKTAGNLHERLRLRALAARDAMREDLRAGAYVGLRVKNVLLSFLTLGFYRPFAIASEYAAKVGSVTIHVKGSPEQLVGELVQQQGAFGDAAADALGLDLIG